ncbi:aminopeptidase Ey-like [Conger conger]|uniref:aminopeptidase Ey-like n=1 Tax=Conger conger TaxID=82655 RepID=UPI002A5A8205|nr:aminopeptidase Ey-like [Conger conger]
MAKGFFISKTLGVVGIVVGAGAVATIIALSVVYAEEKSKNTVEGGPVTTTVKPSPTDPTAPTIPNTPAPPNDPWNRYRLPDSLVPESYNVTLWPRLELDGQGMYIFTGNSTVIFKCLKETDLILIHSNKLKLTRFNDAQAMLHTVDGSTAPTIKTTWLEEPTQYLVVQLDGKLTAGKSYGLYTEFRGELADDLAGFYRSEYYEDGVKKVVATSQMHPTYARKTFPCFDEPALKAIFYITLIHQPGTVALSNGKDIDTVNTTINGTAVTQTTFEPTKTMSTYLLALIVSDYRSIDSAEDKVLIRIWARKKAIADGHGDYALNVTGPVLKFFEGYYNVDYPLSKSDQIALPDFYFGAMENWGLVTYRETNLLYDPIMSSNANKERTASIIAHELAHMWFGNLVTLRWWNEVWLNEGFASYVEYLGTDYAEPTWNIKDLIVLNDVHRVFAIDALASSHPLSSKEDEIYKPEQITELFDAISYSKGASVLRMLSEFLTEEVFVRGLGTYLKEFAYSNTVGADLWDHLQRAANETNTPLPETVPEIMNRWVLQMGFPVVTINTATGALSQQHFLLDPNSTVDRPSEYFYKWYVPIRWMKSGLVQDQYWLMTDIDTNTDMAVTGADWVLANLNVTGYYRVNYDQTNWDRLLGQLNSDHQAIPAINRAQLVDDAFNLARAEMVDTTLALSTTTYLSNERDYMPWESALDNLEYFSLMFDRTEVYGPMQAYLRSKVRPLFDHFKQITSNWTDVPEGHTDQYNQVNAIRMACSTGVAGCEDLTRGWFREWMQDPNNNTINPNLRTTVYCSAIAAGGVAEWDFGWEMFRNATMASEAEKLRSALACTKEPWLLNRYLEYTLDPTKIRKQDATSTIVYIADNVVGQSLAWDFVRAKWEYIFTQYGASTFSFAQLISGVTKRFSTEFELEQLEQFKADNAEGGFGTGTLALEQSIERTKANIKWLAANQKQVKEWFENESKPKENFRE